MLTIRNLLGFPLDATCLIHETPRGCEITFECRGGARGTPQARNLDYTAGLESVLQRLAMARCVVTDAFLDTRLTKRLGLGREQARLNMPTFPYPVCLTPSVDLLSLRNEMCAHRDLLVAEQTPKVLATIRSVSQWSSSGRGIGRWVTCQALLKVLLQAMPAQITLHRQLSHRHRIRVAGCLLGTGRPLRSVLWRWLHFFFAGSGKLSRTSPCGSRATCIA